MPSYDCAQYNTFHISAQEMKRATIVTFEKCSHKCVLLNFFAPSFTSVNYHGMPIESVLGNY